MIRQRRADYGGSPPETDAGYVTPTFVATVGLTMVLLVMFANVLSVHYARGVMQAAAEEGGRQGVAVGTDRACLARADSVIRNGLGTMGRDVGPAQCTITAEGAVVEIPASFSAWVPGLPTFQTQVQASVRMEAGT